MLSVKNFVIIRIGLIGFLLIGGVYVYATHHQRWHKSQSVAKNSMHPAEEQEDMGSQSKSVVSMSWNPMNDW